MIKTLQGTYAGIELRDLPAAQAFSGSSRIATVPAWRIPQSTEHLSEVPDFLREALQRDFNLTVRHLWELGGSYFTSPGVTPELVHPYVAEVEVTMAEQSFLHFVEIGELIANIDLLRDAQLLISTYRVRHALGEP